MAEIILGAATLNQTPLDWEGNTANILDAINKAKAEKVRLLCLPEMTIPGYGCQDMFFQPWIAKRSEEILWELKNICDDIYVAVGLPFQVEGKLYNAMALLGENKILGLSLKQSLPDDGIYYEPRWFKSWNPGEQTLVKVMGDSIAAGEIIYNVDGIPVGFEICEEAWRKERPADRLVEKGVRIILNPSASHYEFGKTVVREQLMRMSSDKYNCTYMFTNLLGNESGKFIYEGDRLIAQNGSIVARGDHFSYENVRLLVKKINTETSDADLPTKLLPKNEEFRRVAGLALFDYFRKSHSRCLLISLSGGADSSTCAVLVREMIRLGISELGNAGFAKKAGRPDLSEADEGTMCRELLHCVYQSAQGSSPETYVSASTLSSELGASFYHWSVAENIREGLNLVEKALGRKLSWEQDDITLQNIQARMRSPIIWTLANSLKGLLLTTGNRSEGDVGYATMDGDTSGSLAPLGGVDKVFIREWLLWAERELNYSSLQFVNKLEPSAELRPPDENQRDEEDLMPYPVLLQIERGLLKKKLSPGEIIKELIQSGIDEKKAGIYTERFFKLWSQNQWKRERMAPAFHFDDLNLDPCSWMRFPVLNGGIK